ncbi:MAG: TetR/AcrR family transcriptional regulator [Candidatus Scatosoma sp.]
MQEKKKRAKKNEITRQIVIQAAFDELRENGWQNWNARTIARRAGCSTMPLFRLFKNMEEIRGEVIARVVKVYEGYIGEGLKEPLAYRGVGKAYIRFAKEEPWLFKALCVSEEFTGRPFASLDPTLPKVLAAAEKSGDVYGEKVRRLHACMTVFCHGAGVMESSRAPLVPEEALDTLMGDVFRALKEYYKILPGSEAERPEENSEESVAAGGAAGRAEATAAGAENKGE